MANEDAEPAPVTTGTTQNLAGAIFPFWAHVSSNTKQSLIPNVISAVAANVLTVVVLALAVIVTRWESHAHGHDLITYDLLSFTLLPLLALLIYILVPLPSNRSTQLVYRLASLGCALIALLGILVTLGLAAGVK